MQPSPLRVTWLVLTLLLCGLAGVTLTVQPVTAQTGTGGEGVPRLQLVGQVGGVIRAADVREPYAYVGLGPQFAVLDLSNPEHPQRVGSTMLSALINAIVIEGGYAYVATNDGLHIINLQNPSKPSRAGHLPLALAHNVAIDGRYAYVSAGQYGVAERGFHIVDISLPHQPRAVSFWSGPAYGVAVQDGLVYVTSPVAASGGLTIVDASDPAAPTTVGALDLERGDSDIVVRDGYAYIAVGPTLDYEAVLLYVINVSVPSTPREESVRYSYYQGTGMEEIALVLMGQHAYIAGVPLRAYDVSNPAQPVGLPISQRIEADGLVVTDGFLYTFARGSRFSIFEKQSPTSFRQAGHLESIAQARDITLEGNHAYIADAGDGFAPESPGLRIADVTNPGEPQLIGSLSLAEETSTNSNITVSGVALSGQRAYLIGTEFVVTGHSGESSAFLAIADIQDPSHPSYIGGYATEFQMQGCGAGELAVIGSYLYTGLCGFSVFDASDPTSPTLVASPDYTMDDIAVRDSSAYVIGMSRTSETLRPELSIFDVSQPDDPATVGSFEFPIPYNWVTGIALSDTYAYVTAFQAGLWVIDISDSTNPTEVGFYRANESGQRSVDIAVWGGYAFVAENNWDDFVYTGGVGRGGVRVYDVSDPSQPRPVDFFSTPGIPQHITVHDGLIYLADDQGGVFVFRFAPVYYQYLPFSFSSSGPG